MYHLNIRTWFDRTNGNTYQSWLLRAAHGTVLHVSPMQYGTAQQAAHDAARYLKAAGLVPESVQYPRECMTIEHAGDGLQRDMHRYTWSVTDHKPSKPAGLKWARDWRRATGENHTEWAVMSAHGMHSGHASLTEARAAAARLMRDGMRECWIERRAYNGVRSRGIVWSTYTRTGPA